jgi:hypothetical protein
MKKKLLLIVLILASAAIAVVLSACNEKSITPTITALDVSVEFDGKPHGVTASLSVAGGLIFTYTGVDNNYSSEIEPMHPGDYSVKIQYISADEKRIQSVEKTVTLRIVFPYTLNVDGTEISAYSGNRKDIIIPSVYKGNQLNSVAANTYSGKNIESIKLPTTVFSVNPLAFTNCETLSKLYISENTKLLSGIYPSGVALEYYGAPAIIKTDAFGAVQGFSALVIPYSIVTLEQNCFASLGVARLVIPSHLPLAEQTISNSIKTISVFDGHKTDNVLPDNFFDGCNSVTRIEIEEGINVFGDGIFRDCSSLDTLIINSTIQSVGDEIFNNCSVKKIEFDLSFTFQDIVIPETLKEIVIYEGIEQIPSYAFYQCKFVEKITLPSTLISIGSYAFSGCRNLTDIELPSGIESIGYYAFEECASLREILLPNTVSEIFDGAFSGCESLETIILPAQLEAIAPFLFEGCKSLLAVEIPNSVIAMGDWAFSHCEKLLGMTLPTQLTTIASHAFAFCVAMETIYFPPNVQFIGGEIFLSCNKLLSVTISSTAMPNINWDAFEGLSSGCIVFVPLALLSDYTSEWDAINFEAIT